MNKLSMAANSFSIMIITLLLFFLTSIISHASFKEHFDSPNWSDNWTFDQFENLEYTVDTSWFVVTCPPYVGPVKKLVY